MLHDYFRDGLICVGRLRGYRIASNAEDDYIFPPASRWNTFRPSEPVGRASLVAPATPDEVCAAMLCADCGRPTHEEALIKGVFCAGSSDRRRVPTKTPTATRTTDCASPPAASAPRC